MPELEGEGSQKSSVNFSRPMLPTESPTFAAQIRPKSQGGWFSGPVVADSQFRNTPFDGPKTVIGISPSEASRIQPDLQNVANRPTTPKKKKRPTLIKGSHLATGAVAAKLTGTADTSSEPVKKFPAPVPEQPVISAAVPSPGSTSADERSPADSSSESSPASMEKKPESFQPRAKALLTKQPSIVYEQPELERQTEDTPSANTGRKIDTSVGRSPTPSAIQSSTTSVTSRQQHVRSQSDDQIALGVPTLAVARQEREKSLSPSRTPHFSLVPIELESGIKHQPPPRSISPAKPALKHSPSSSIRTASPVTNHPAGDGKRSPEVSPVRPQSPQQKRSVRVSFDASPATIISGLETSKHAPANAARIQVVEEPDFEEVYTPRPALPFFGSIRGRKTIEDTSPAVKPVESDPSSLSSSRTLVDQGLSKDHAIGDILAQDFAKQRSAEQVPATTEPAQLEGANNLPLPPVVTSVEGSGYVSDSDDGSHDDKQELANPQTHREEESSEEAPMSPAQKGVVAAIKPPAPEQSKPEEVEAKTIETTSQREAEILPAIAVHPASPEAEAEEQLFIVPGAFPAWESSLEVNKQGLTEEAHMQNEPPTSTEPPSVSASASLILGEPPIELTSPKPDEESDSDNGSIYSDAAESPSELFTSIDAIVESPIGKPNQGLSITTDKATSTSSPLASLIQGSHAGEEKELPTAAEVETTEEHRPVALRPPTPPKPKKKKKTPTVQDEPGPVTASAIHQAQARLASCEDDAVAEQRQPTSKKSMRTQHEQTNVEDQHTIPKTLRQPKSGLYTSRHAPQGPRGTLQKHNPLAKVAPTPAQKSTALAPPPSTILTKAPIPPSMQRRGSTDSESSFKRYRVSTNVGESISLRRTLRQPPASSQPTAGAEKVGRVSLRTQSPPTTLPPRQTRASLRQSIDSDPLSPDPKRKNRRSALSPSRFPGFGKSGKSKAKSVIAAATPSIPAAVSRFRSRFASDDEDEPAQPARAMGSRFADSDDDLDDPTSPIPTEMPAGLTPVRGIPKRAGGDDDEASELLPGEDESSSDDEAPPMPSGKEMEIATALARERLAAQGVIANGKVRGDKDGEPGGLATSKYAPSAAAASDAAQRPAQKRRWGLFGSSGRKDGQRKREGDAPSGSEDSGPSSPLRGPKLQRRVTPAELQQVPEDSWPLPPPPAGIDADAEDKPNTSDGAVDGGGDGMTAEFGDSPDTEKRGSTADEHPERRLSKSSEPAYNQRTGKAKRFMKLRRAFGLRD